MMIVRRDQKTNDVFFFRIQLHPIESTHNIILQNTNFHVIPVFFVVYQLLQQPIAKLIIYSPYLSDPRFDLTQCEV